MQICIVGAGAIGGLMGVRLATSGQELTFIDIGKQLAAIQEKGLKLVMDDGTEHIARYARATDNYDEVGPQDIVVLALKAHIIPSVAEQLPALFGPKTIVVTVQNGIPWWYFQKHGGPFEGRCLKSLDPTGIIEAHVDPDRIIGCAAYPAAAVVKPGIVQHIEGDRFPIGELDGSGSQRCKELSQVLSDVGFRSRILGNIRSEIWLKAWGNLSFNPISALTHSTLVDICQFPETRELSYKMMKEAQEIAHKLGIEFRHPIEKRIAGAEGVGKHKTSMLQDVEAGRFLEIEALMGSIIELGRLTEISIPSIEAVYACVRLLNKTFTEATARVDLIPLD